MKAMLMMRDFDARLISLETVKNAEADGWAAIGELEIRANDKVINYETKEEENK